jgi:hypothetical protein
MTSRESCEKSVPVEVTEFEFDAMKQIEQANFLADSKRSAHSSLFRLKSTQVNTQIKQFHNNAHASVPTLSEPSFRFEGNESYLLSVVEPPLPKGLKLNRQSKTLSSQYKRFKYTVAVMGESRDDNQELIRQLLPPGIPFNKHVDEFEIDLHVDN